MEFDENPDHRAIREAVAKIAAPYGGQYYTQHAEAHTPTDELWRALGRQGFIGINLPEQFGGGGAGLAELAAGVRGDGRAGRALAPAAGLERDLRRGPGPLRQPAAAAGLAPRDGRAASARWSSRSPSPTPARIRTSSRPARERDGDEWVLRGTKYYISGVNEADALVVVARTGTDPATGKGLMSLFLVPTDSAGLVANELPVSASLPEKQYTLFFDDVRLDAGALIGAENAGFQQVFHGLNPERITGAAICVGVGRRALAVASQYARNRAVWGQPIGTHQGISHALAKAKIEVDLAALMTAKAAWLHDHGLPAGEASNEAKYAAAEAGIAAVDAAIQTHGGNGMSTEFGLLPLWGITRLLRIAPVSAEMVLNYVAQHSLGLPRSY